MAPHAEALPSLDQSHINSKTPLSKSANTTNTTEDHHEAQQLEATSDTTAAQFPDPILQMKPTQTRFTPNDVLPHRTTCPPMVKGVAPFSTAQMFKSPSALSRPKASRNYYNHLTAEARQRQPGSLKGAMKYFNPQMISLCGGLPSSEYFPFEELSVQVTMPAADFSAREGMSVARSRKFDIAEGKSEYDLSVALNYAQSMGPAQLMRFMTEHTEIVHAPPYSDWDICFTQGSTSALDIVLRMFCARGDTVITEEYSFSSAIETARPMGLELVGIKMDGKGMCPKDLDFVLSNWEEGAKVGPTKYNGAKRPKFLYTVPTGQNPTGATQDLARRKAILEICERHDVFILEDEPYYFLQMEDYVSPAKQMDRANGANGAHINGNVEKAKNKDLGEFIEALTPSYLSLSKTGNVMRMDSFSKIVAPGSRVGWVTGPANIIERYLRASEVSAQNPSGFSAMVLYKLLEEQWGHEGFLRWLQHLRGEYTWRRDGIVDACERYLPTEIVQFEAPMAGMFHWLRVDGSKHPLWREKGVQLRTDASRRKLLEQIEERGFLKGTVLNVLVARGSWFRTEKSWAKPEEIPPQETVANGQANGHDEEDAVDTTVYFRMTFAAAPMDKITEAVKRFGQALREEFGLEQVDA